MTSEHRSTIHEDLGAWRALYGETSLALCTDLYQLTMAYGYWKSGEADTQAVFHLSFRRHPFGGGYAIACGIAQAIDWARALRFEPHDLAYLATLTGNDGAPLFEQAFLDYLSELRCELTIEAVREGEVVFAHEPLVRVSGPIIQCQLVETAMLTMVNFQTLIATKSSRVARAIGQGTMLEFGLRRAQGIDGGVSASRAAFVGGAHATSNVLAGKLFGLPVRGTHAHSWVMCFEDEREAFMRYAEAMPNNCVFLVDTYDTLDGVRRAIEVGRELRARGHEMVGVRLDSGDLAYLSIHARQLLDEAGFEHAAIVASNDLDEHTITSLLLQGAPIAVWGVGTKLATAYDQPALGGVYKLSAIRREGDRDWRDRVKLSEQAIKTSNPGILQIYRCVSHGGEFEGDAIIDVREPVQEAITIVDPIDPTRRKRLDTTDGRATFEPLLVPWLREGAWADEVPSGSAHAARDYAQARMAPLYSGVFRLHNPHQYPVGLTEALYDKKTQLVLSQRGFQS